MRYILCLIAIASIAYAARSNICLTNAGTPQPYRPLQLYTNDCPKNSSNCMAAVYNYDPSTYTSKAPSKLLPNSTTREAVVYMTQDESGSINIVMSAASSYSNNIIQVNSQMIGAAPGAQILLKDDPTKDQWYWNSTSNSGVFVWYISAGLTDGVVLGNVQIVDNFCFQVSFYPHNESISHISFLSGNLTNLQRVFTSQIVDFQVYEFCQFPQVIISTQPASCNLKGNATVVSINGTASEYMWQDLNGTTVGTTGTVLLSNGDYTVSVTVNGCTATRPVYVGYSGVALTVEWDEAPPTLLRNGTITVAITSGTSPYYITWSKDGKVVGTGIELNAVVVAGSYLLKVVDGCGAVHVETIVVAAPVPCTPGQYIDPTTTYCFQCPAGTYSTKQNADSCITCPPGTFNNVRGSTNCTTCTANHMSPGGSSPCVDCNSSTISPAGSAGCTPCAVGTDRAAYTAKCVTCPAGWYRGANDILCQPCPVNSTSPAGAASCSSCQSPQVTITTHKAYCKHKGNATAHVTGSATYLWRDSTRVIVGTTSTVQLSMGDYTVTVIANGCATTTSLNIGYNGELPDVDADQSVTTINQNYGGIGIAIYYIVDGPFNLTWTSGGEQVISTDGFIEGPPGVYSFTLIDSCGAEVSQTFIIYPFQPCPAGQYVLDQGVCNVCNIGTYSTGINEDDCTPCPPGTYTDERGSITCKTCPNNQIPGIYQESCVSCNESYYSLPGSAVCSPCPVGTERAMNESTCTSCGYGQYRSESDTMCKPCPPGTFADADGGQATCTPCPPNTYSWEGVYCFECPYGTLSLAGSGSCS